MRIVDVCAFYTPHGGGVRTYVERKLRAARPHGHEVVIVAPGSHDTRSSPAPGATLLTVAAPVFPLDRRYRYFADEAGLHGLLDKLAPDVVEASSPWGSAAMVGRWPGAALRALVMHADPLAAYPYRWFGRFLSRRQIDRGFDWFWRHLRRLDRSFDLVVSASASLSARLSSGGLGKVVTVPMGVEAGPFSPARRDPALRRALLARCGLPPEATLLVGLGRLAPEKRWPMVVEAVAAAGIARPVGLWLLGDGRGRAPVVRAASNNPHVRLGAPVADRAALAAILASADALVHGCEAETFCMVAAEARASGVPLLVPDAGGASDQLGGGAGLSYPAGSAAGLADAIGRLSAERARFAAAARRAAPTVPTVEAHFTQLFATYAARLATRAPCRHAA